MTCKPPPSLVPAWWRRALSDGTHCENKRRERWFHEYLEAAEESLSVPGDLIGPFQLLYRRGFRLGYDNARLLRARGLPRFKKRAKLAR